MSWRAVHGVPSGQVGRVLHNLGYLAFKQGRLARAWRLLSWALVMRTAIAAPAYVLALTISTLGEVALARGNPCAAMELFTYGYELRLAWFAAAHDATAESQYLLACAWLALGDAEQAQALLAEAADVTRRGLGEQHRQMVFILTAQARVALSQGRPDLAQERLDAALAIAHAVLGTHHPETMVVWYWIGRAAAQAGDQQRARAAFETADQGQQTLLWSGHYQRAETALALARLDLDVGEAQQAQALLTRVIADGRRAGTLALPAFVSCRRLLQTSG
jgi:tetratricopeptide (TPR) repeat protein